MNGTGVVRLGHVPVGDGHPTVLVAEVGTFFNQSLELAGEYLRQVAAAGAPLFKTEILHDPDVCLPGTGLVHEYRHAHGTGREDYRSLIERKCNALPRYAELFDQCRALGMPFLATVYDFIGVDFLAEQKAAAIKIARDNVDNLPLIRHAARTGLPIVFDAGMVRLHEIARAVEEARRYGCSEIIVNHHPGRNPAPPEAHNLRAIPAYKQALGLPVGLACHYRGEELLYTAVGVGANLIEKGVDADPDRAEQDLISATPLRKLSEIVRLLDNCWKALGAFPLDIPDSRDLSTRKGLAAARPIAAGEALTLDNVRFAWPPTGISVAHWDLVEGRRARRPLAQHQPIAWEDIGLES